MQGFLRNFLTLMKLIYLIFIPIENRNYFISVYKLLLADLSQFYICMPCFFVPFRSKVCHLWTVTRWHWVQTLVGLCCHVHSTSTTCLCGRFFNNVSRWRSSCGNTERKLWHGPLWPVSSTAPWPLRHARATWMTTWQRDSRLFHGE